MRLQFWVCLWSYLAIYSTSTVKETTVENIIQYDDYFEEYFGNYPNYTICLSERFEEIHQNASKCAMRIKSSKYNIYLNTGVFIIGNEPYNSVQCPFGTYRVDNSDQLFNGSSWKSSNEITQNAIMTNISIYGNLVPSCVIENDVLKPCDGFIAQHLCIFDFGHKYHCPKHCVSSSLPTRKCYCITYDLNKWTFADFYYTDLIFLKKYYSFNYPSKIGLKNSSDYPIGDYYAIISKDGLSFAPNGTTKYYLYPTEPIFKNVSLSLKVSKQKLYLTIKNFSGAYLNPNYPVCYTNAGNGLQEIIDTEFEFSSEKEDIAVYKIKLEKDPGQYWCFVQELPDMRIVKSNVVVAHKKLRGNDYALRLSNLNGTCSTYETLDANLQEIIKLSVDTLLMGMVSKVVVRPMMVYNITTYDNHCNYDVLFHLTSKKRIDVTRESRIIRKRLSDLDVVFLRSSYFCMEETYSNLTWKVTRIQTSSISSEFCIQESGLPVTRKCLGNFFEGGYWDAPEVTCHSRDIANAHTKKLHQIITTANYTRSPEALDEVHNMTKTEVRQFSALDIFYISSILKESVLDNSDLSSEAFLSTIENLMDLNRTYLELAQKLYHSSDDILRVLDYYLAEHDEGHAIFTKAPNIIIQKTYPFRDGIYGVAMYNVSNTMVVRNLTGPLQKDDKTNLVLAAYVEPELLEEMVGESERNNITLNIVMFLSDVLFVESEKRSRPSNIVSVSIPEIGSSLPKPVKVLVKTDSANSTCAFWQYSESLEIYDKSKSYWSKSGGSLVLKDHMHELVECEFNHLTHFALLLRGNNPEEENNADFETHDDILDVITICGSVLSLLGATGIFATAIVFKKWRQNIGSKLLLHLFVAILSEIVVIQLAGYEFWTKSDTTCLIIGFILQYSVLSKFFWMLLIAWLQYVRFVRVITVMPKRILLKSVLFCWGLPLLPTALTVAVSPSSYSQGSQKFCYPKDLSLYLGVFLPIVVIVSVNTFIFSKIIFSLNGISHEVEMRKNISKDNVKRQTYLAILLFFLLGIPWVFGIMSEVFEQSVVGLIFSYIFCMSATIQGFVLFVFYVILDPVTQSMWAKFKFQYIVNPR